jgi:Uma2 family endonuclease
MATAAPLISIEEYLHTSYKPDVHFIDGEIEERNVGEYDHAKIQTLIVTAFSGHEDAWQTDAIVEQRIRIDSSRVRICDIAVLHRGAPREQVTTTPPYICIEVLSPEDRLSCTELVLADYFAMGVPNIWLIDPYARAAYTFGPAGLQPNGSVVLTIPGTTVELDLAPMFARLDA